MTMTSGAEGVRTQVIGVQPKITIEGSLLNAAQMASLLSLEVESTVGRADLCEVRILQTMDPQGTPSDDVNAGWVPGKQLKIEWDTTVVFDGEITSVDFLGGNASSTEIVLLAFDKRHRMYRQELVNVYLDSTFKDIVGNLLGRCGLGHDLSGLPPTVMKYYLHEGSVGDLIERLCDQYGLYCLWKSGKVLVKKSSELSDEAGVLRGTAELLEFRFRQTTSADYSKAEVRGWDPKKKEAIVGTGSRADALPGGGVVAGVDSMKDFTETTLRDTAFVSAVAEANARAVGALTSNVDAGMQLDATVFLDPRMAAGKVVVIQEVPKRFAGKYRLTSVRHRYDHLEGGRSVIVCRGADDTTLSGLLEQAVLGGAPAGRRLGHGLQPAVVSNLKSDPAGGALGKDGAAGEVKVKLPWLGDNIESGWLRVVTVGGGNGRGLMVMPEVNDEVLVAFHDGDTRSGYVLGGLYNGLDAAPRSGTLLSDGSAIHERVWRSKAGHEIVLGDKGGEEYVQITSSDVKMTIRLDVKEGMITIDSKGDVMVAAEGDLGIDAKGAVSITAGKDLKLEGQNVKIAGQQNVDVKAALNATVEGTAGAAVKGAKVDINSQGPATVKGTPIMLN